MMFDDPGAGATPPIQLAPLLQFWSVPAAPLQVKAVVGSPDTGTLVADNTAIVPSTASLLVHTSPLDDTTCSAVPLATGLLKILKLSPATSGMGPRFRTVSVSAPPVASVPATVTRSLEGESDLSTSMISFPEKARLLPNASVPNEVPGDNVLFALSVAGPPIVPLPPRVPPEFT